LRVYNILDGIAVETRRLKAVPLAGLIEASGVKLARQGAGLAGLCPFHAETRRR
jgi:DNA primase